MPRFSIDPDIARATTLDTAFYTDPSLFLLAREKLFAPSWQFVGDDALAFAAGDVPLASAAGDAGPALASAAGDALPLTLLEGFLDEPLVLVRGRDSGLRLLSNVCTHRGNIVVGQPCRLTQLRCRYHGRIFDLDGRFRSMPEFREVANFPSAADNLTSLPLEKWGPWLFTSLTAPGRFRDYWGDMIDRLHWLPLEKFVLRPELSRDFVVKAHWALYCENYLEGFHIPYLHAGLNSVIDFGNYTTELFRYSSLQLGIAKDDEEIFDLPASSPDHGKKVAAYYFFVFPNLMFNFYPWGLSINIIKPVGLSETRVSFLTYIADETKYDKGAGSGLDIVEFEDEEVVEAVQRGVRSRFYTHGRYSVTREQGTHHFHRLIAENI